MNTNTPVTKKEPGQDTTDIDYDALEQDLAENLAYKNRGCCTRVAHYFCSFFKSSSPVTKEAAEFKPVDVNPVFSLNH